MRASTAENHLCQFQHWGSNIDFTLHSIHKGFQRVLKEQNQNIKKIDFFLNSGKKWKKNTKKNLISEKNLKKVVLYEKC